MEQLHQYALIVDEDQRNDKLDILTYIGAFFVVPSFIGTYFGIADYDLSEHWMWISVFSVLSAGLAFFTIRTTGRTRTVLLALLTALMLGIIFLFPYLKAPWG
jgi:Mg2+ and Co2+ transporter CorA